VLIDVYRSFSDEESPVAKAASIKDVTE